MRMSPVIDILSKNFRSNYHPGREVAIDEMMIGTRCRTSFIQYMPKKPVKFGIKMWALCESKTGYCLEFQLYKGRENDTAEKGLTFRVCTDLMKNYYGENHHLYTDNFYSSCALYNHLEKHDTFGCGTIKKKNGRFPEDFKCEKWEKGTTKYLKSGNLLAVRWVDKRDVFLISNIHSTGMVEITRKTREVIQKPLMIDQYNHYMGGVDKCDQYQSNYDIARKSRKWWKKVFLRMFELAVINSYIVYRALNPEINGKKANRSHRLFRFALIHEMVQILLDARADPNDGANVERNGRPSTSDSSRLSGKHFPKKECVFCLWLQNSKWKED